MYELRNISGILKGEFSNLVAHEIIKNTEGFFKSIDNDVIWEITKAKRWGIPNNFAIYLWPHDMLIPIED